MNGTVRVSLWIFRLSQVMLLCMCVLFLSACQKNWAPVAEIHQENAKLSGIHIVQPNETLYAIGWRYSRDFKELAAINQIEPPYVIHVGQKISLTGSAPAAVATPAPVQQQSATPAPIVATVPASASTLVQTPAPVQTGPVSQWQWPVKGEVIARFAQSKGIDIAGQMGANINAAADGRVVYAGNGLRGYGQLLIIKHNEQFLSAYAHNSQLLAKEGDWVKLGQPIALMGRTDTNRVKLHFEIRKDGKPVDPLKYLPT